jgi:Integrase core domain.
MALTLHSNTGLLAINGMTCIYHKLPNSYVSISYQGVNAPPSVLHISEVESKLNKEIFLISTKEKFASKFMTLTHSQQAEVAWRKRCVDYLYERIGRGKIGGTIVRNEVAAQLMTENPSMKVSAATLARWAKYDQEHALGVAADILKAPSSRESKYSEDVIQLALDVIDDNLLKPNMPTIQWAYDIFKDKFEDKFGADVDRPCYRIFNDWFKKLCCPIDALQKMHGRFSARELLRNAVRQIVVERPLERVEADAVYVGVGLVDEEGNYLGTPVIFFVIDCFSRSVLGLHMQIGKGESSVSVQDSIRHAMLPKDAETEGDWPMYGLFERLYTDGGPGYTALDTTSFALYYQCTVTTVKTGRGSCKPFIERFIGTTRQCFFSTLPGYVGKLKDKRMHDLSVKEQAVTTPQAFLRMLKYWIVNEYHHKPHGGLNEKTPYQVWQESVELYPPTLPANYQDLATTVGITEYKKIHGAHCHQGVLINNVYYNDAAGVLKNIGLKLIHMNQEPTVECCYSSNDISKISVLNEFDGQRYLIPAVDPAVLPDMSLAEYKAKNPSTYSNKGFGHTRVMPDHPDFKATNSALNAKLKQQHSRKQRNAIPEDYDAKIEAMQSNSTVNRPDEPQQADKTKSNIFGDIDLNNLKGHSNV